MDTKFLKNTMNHLELIDIYKKISHKIHIAFKGTWNIYHTLGHKINFKKFKRMEIMQTMFPDHNKIKLQIN